MNAQQLLEQLDSDVKQPFGEVLVLKKQDAKSLLAHVNHLEGVIVALLRSHYEKNESPNIVLPYRATP